VRRVFSGNKGKTMGTRLWDELDMLPAKLDQAETAHLQALSVGDPADTYKARIRLGAVVAERNRVLGNYRLVYLVVRHTSRFGGGMGKIIFAMVILIGALFLIGHALNGVLAIYN
jgi:hypothetical protein